MITVKEKRKRPGFELSHDGNSFFRINEINTQEVESLENDLLSIITRLRKLNSVENRLNDRKNIYLKINTDEINRRSELLNNSAKRNYSALTKKEIEVMLFIAKGYKESDISFYLNMTINTFCVHRKSIYRKLGVKNKLQLTEWGDRYLNGIFKKQIKTK